MDWIVSLPPNSCVEILTHKPQNVTLLGNRTITGLTPRSPGPAGPAEHREVETRRREILRESSGETPGRAAVGLVLPGDQGLTDGQQQGARRGLAMRKYSLWLVNMSGRCAGCGSRAAG